MRFLLDVNALLSLGYPKHVFHLRVARWVAQPADRLPLLATSAITELGFVRILPQLPGFDGGFDGARRLLAQLKGSQPGRFELIADDLGAEDLPPWVKSSRQTTDGHLLALARKHGFELATLDADIPGSFLIPA